MSQREFLSKLLEKMESVGIPSMVSGSLGSSFHGEPRSTNDIDIVIAPNRMQLSSFIESLGDDYYVSGDHVKEAFEAQTMFNIIEHKTGWKADLIIRKDRPFSKMEFDRKIRAKILDIMVFVVSPEDQILSKLEWAKAGESERQFKDALGVASIQDDLDLTYLRKWARELGVEVLLKQLLDAADERKQNGDD